MTSITAWGWPALFLLGAYHGINPGMGWLFAVARGMQEHATKAVACALLPIIERVLNLLTLLRGERGQEGIGGADDVGGGGRLLGPSQ